MSLKINPSFRDLIPGLSKDEYSDLESSLKKDGCLDAIKIWNGTIIDGHNRYKICTQNKIRFETVEVEFADESEAKIWIIKNQFARRNISTATRAMLALELEPLFRGKARESYEQNVGRPDKSLQNSVTKTTKVNTQKEVAKIAGISHSTVYEAKKVKESDNEEVKQKMLTGEISIHKAYTEVMPKTETKVCTLCKKELPVSEFYDSKAQCKKCHAFAKRVGAEDAKKIQAFNSIDVEAIIENMAKKEPSDDGCRNDLDNHIIAEYVALVKSFRTSVNRFVYMPAAFKEVDKDSEAIKETEKLLSELSTIIKNAKGE